MTLAAGTSPHKQPVIWSLRPGIRPGMFMDLLLEQPKWVSLTFVHAVLWLSAPAQGFWVALGFARLGSPSWILGMTLAPASREIETRQTQIQENPVSLSVCIWKSHHQSCPRDSEGRKESLRATNWAITSSTLASLEGFYYVITTKGYARYDSKGWIQCKIIHMLANY